MKISELEEGDVLFTMLGNKPPALHTQIYAGDSHFTHTIIHAVDDTRRDGPSKLMATGLKTDSILVYRCLRTQLAYEAYVAAIRWIKYLVPYDQERKTLKEAFRNLQAGTSDIVPLLRTLFLRHGIFRAIKYTARREEILCYPSDGELSRGLTCTMFVILCYQAAALSGQVARTSEFSSHGAQVRISDKKMSKEELANLGAMAKFLGKQLHEEDVRIYRDYVGLLQSGNEYSLKWEDSGRDAPTRKPNPRLQGYLYVPSILCWNGPQSIAGFDFVSAMTAGMMVDAKITTSEQLRLSLEADKLIWVNKGYLDNSEMPARDENYKEKLDQYAQWAKTSADKFRPGSKAL